MALNGAVLGLAIQTAIADAVAAHPESSDAQRTAIWKNIGEAIVAHIQGATVTIAAGSIATGVTAGAATVPVTGTAVIS